MKFKNLIGSLLVEASKKDTLINKLGVNEYNADALADTAGPLTIFFAYKILEKYEAEYHDTAERAKEIIKRNQTSIQNRMALVNGSNSFVRERNKLRGIMDWVRVALAGNIKAYEQLTFDELYDESERWHESLGVGESKFDYNEENNVVLDFRKNGEGYYWADLGTGNCPSEAERMGHCASSRGNLYSLRSFRKIENDHTLNKSHLTASVDGGDLLQLKGQKNSKPTNEYHALILPLFYLKNGEDYLINKIGYEYDSSRDFKISDLTTEEITKLYADRPELFTTRQEIKILKSLGLIEPTTLDYKFTLNIPLKNADHYVRGELKDTVQDILAGDTWQYWDNYQYADWESSIQYHIDEDNSRKIVDMLRNTEGFDETLSLTDLIKECGDDADEIISALKTATNDAEAQDYESYLYDELKSAYSEFGNVTLMNDEGVVIEVDLESLMSTNNIDDEVIDDFIERCEDSNKYADPECIFEELLSEGYIEKARFDVDNRWYPSIDNNNFNEILNDRLNEI